MPKPTTARRWLDVHVTTEGPRPDFGGTFSYLEALNKLADGAKHRVVIFEYNAGNHSQRRALANAAATIRVQRDGRLPVVTSANCLQPDGQNDNDWDQDLCSSIHRKSAATTPRLRHADDCPELSTLDRKAVEHPASSSLDVCATRSEDGKTLVLQVVNAGDQEITLPLKSPASFRARKRPRCKHSPRALERSQHRRPA
ncbi:MAG: hypothetical protein U1F83_14565 [Verrucomicrobiota bacterium]